MNKKTLMIGGIALLAMVIVGGILLFINNQTSEKEESPNPFNENLIEMSAEDVGLTLSSQQNNQQVVMEMSKLDEVESFEYELSYDAVENGETISQGTFGSGPNDEEQGASTIRRVMDLGTCSAGRCRYHEGVEEVLLSLKVTLRNGEVGLIEEVFVLE